jgi:putative transposase
MDGETNHVHLLVNYPPKVSVSSLGELPEGRFQLLPPTPVASDCQVPLGKMFCARLLIFAASCGGAPLEVIKRYIDQQATPI